MIELLSPEKISNLPLKTKTYFPVELFNYLLQAYIFRRRAINAFYFRHFFRCVFEWMEKNKKALNGKWKRVETKESFETVNKREFKLTEPIHA
jgi:hypothetical protein